MNFRNRGTYVGLDTSLHTKRKKGLPNKKTMKPFWGKELVWGVRKGGAVSCPLQCPSRNRRMHSHDVKCTALLHDANGNGLVSIAKR